MPEFLPVRSEESHAACANQRSGGENGPGLETGKFLAPHGIAPDSKGAIYVGEVGVADCKTSFPETPMPAEVSVVRCLQKLEKV